MRGSPRSPTADIGSVVGILKLAGQRVLGSIFTIGHFGLGTILEEAIGRITEQVGSYFGNR